MGAQIHFFSEDIDFKVKQKTRLRKWVTETAISEGKRAGELNIIFCSDEYLLNINQEYLNHDTYTDIITFDNSEKEDELSGDIFISVARVNENAASLAVDEAEELRRVIIHGILHLAGYLDKSTSEKEIMTAREDWYLARYNAQA